MRRKIRWKRFSVDKSAGTSPFFVVIIFLLNTKKIIKKTLNLTKYLTTLNPQEH
jgi:hypothetical protein